MSRKFLVNIDLNKNELQNAAIQNLATAPSSPVAGQIYFNTTANTLYFFNGTSWIDVYQAATIAADTFSNRPVAGAGNAGTLFYATDTHILYYSNGSAWSQISQFGTVSAQTSYGDTSSSGTSNDYARADHTHGTPALGTATPTPLGIADSGSAGTGTLPSKQDHTHAGPGFGGVTAQTSFGAASGNGAAATVAHSDHTHGTPVHDNAAHSAINLSALAAPAADVSMATYKITNLGNPSADQDAATKYYVDQAVQGLTWKAPVNLVATSNVAMTGSTGTLTIDGDTLTSAESGYRLLLIAQSTATNNGLWVYTDNGSTYSMTRATDGDPYTELIGATVFVLEGTAEKGTSWSQQNHYITSFAGQDWVQIAGVGLYTAGNGINIVGTAISAKAGSGITVDGSGINIDTSVVVRKFAASIGDGTSTSFTITHNLGTRDIQVTVYDNTTPYAEVVCDVQHSTTNTATILVSTAPTSNQYRVVVQG